MKDEIKLWISILLWAMRRKWALIKVRLSRCKMWRLNYSTACEAIDSVYIGFIFEVDDEGRNKSMDFDITVNNKKKISSNNSYVKKLLTSAKVYCIWKTSGRQCSLSRLASLSHFNWHTACDLQSLAESWGNLEVIQTSGFILSNGSCFKGYQRGTSHARLSCALMLNPFVYFWRENNRRVRARWNGGNFTYIPPMYFLESGHKRLRK